MAILKSLNKKNKTFVFTSYENDKDAAPAKVIFNRFPYAGETYAPVDRKDIFQGIDLSKITEEDTKLKVSENIIANFMDNIIKGNVDFKKFFDECIDRFENLKYEQSDILTSSDFWQILPQDAADTIARELLEYASKREEFTMGELSA